MKYLFTLMTGIIMSTTSFAQGSDRGKVSAAISKEEAGIGNTLDEFIAAWNIHDTRAFAMVFAEDADFTNVRGMGAHGRDAIQKFHQHPFETWFKESHQTMVAKKIRFIRPDIAAVDMWWEMTGSKSPDGKEVPLRKGLLNFLMTKTGDKWLITVMHNMDLP
jgi:uncharacterized protein (TIGR02246 family)